MPVLQRRTPLHPAQGSFSLFTFETFHQSHEEAWPDQLKDNNKGKDKDKCRGKAISMIPSREMPE